MNLVDLLDWLLRNHPELVQRIYNILDVTEEALHEMTPAFCLCPAH